MKIKKIHFGELKDLVNFDMIESSDDMQRNLEKIAEILQKVEAYNTNEWFVIDKITVEKI